MSAPLVGDRLDRAEAHARQRAQERYELELTQEDMDAIAEQCRRGQDVLWNYVGNQSRQIVKVRYKGREIRVAYDVPTGIVVRVLSDEE